VINLQNYIKSKKRKKINLVLLLKSTFHTTCVIFYFSLFIFHISLIGQPITCVACDKQYRVSDYDGNYEVIGEKKSVKFIENSVNKKPVENITKEEKIKKSADLEPEPEFLSPLFDMSDAPILDFSSFSSVSEDPSLLISKVNI
jgi:hypothetical protein